MTLRWKKVAIIAISTVVSELTEIAHWTLSTGVGYLIRKMANSVSSTVQLVKEGENSYSFHTVSTFRSQKLSFVLNEEFIEETMDGRKMKCKVTFEGNKMIQQQTGEKAIRIEREFKDDELIAKCIIGDVVATRWFKAVE